MEDLWNKNQDQIQSFLVDESKCLGWAESISFPQSEEEIQAIMARCMKQRIPLTIQGSRTGLCGGAVPQGGHVLNLSKMNRILEICAEESLVRVEPGVLLKELSQVLRQKRRAKALFFPPDPTETLASLGGMAACNASGANSFFYGASRKYVNGIRMVTSKGVLHLKRGEKTQHALLADLGGMEGCCTLETVVPGKNAAGYAWDPEGDAVDLLLSSEGTLGVISQLELRLLPVPEHKMGILFFFKENRSAIDFTRWLRGEEVAASEERPVGFPIAVEYMNGSAFQIVADFREIKPELKQFQLIPKEIEAGIYVEFHEETEEQMEREAEQLLRLAEDFQMEAGMEWCAFDEEGLERIKIFRHAVPECVNLRMDERKMGESRLRKLGTDFAVPKEKLKACMVMYQQGVEELGIDSVIFGHIGDNHLHVNLLPSTWKDYQEGQRLIERWAGQVVAWQGTITAEHGVGRSKRTAFERMFSSGDIEMMKAIKVRFDPDGILNPGVIFEAKTPAES